MRIRQYTLITLLVLTSLLMGACATQATQAPEVMVEEPQPVATEVGVAEQPVATEEVVVVEEPVRATEAELDAAYLAFLTDMEAYNTIGLDGLNEMMAESQPYILDVREYSELEENGYIEGAVNIPLRQVLDNPGLLPAFDEPIVSYCGSGWRCTIALTALEGLGWEDVRGLKGGSYGGWVD
ncbi:MAG: rhodanese-like domain-containing protein, partial [Anaerolineales bacterium]|nr:rhodanese-like domain-containing protein [Anaerolineales bacterium]